MEEADRLCRRVAIMDHGKILALDTPAGLKQSVGADTIVTVKAAGDQKRLAEILQSDMEGVTRVRETEDALELHVRGGQRLLARVVAVAEGAGFEVADLSVAEPSLETVFISLTGRELRD
jgi:ABC-2 type transport system ATP-binding protein